jgi:hypothetical protein
MTRQERKSLVKKVKITTYGVIGMYFIGALTTVVGLGQITMATRENVTGYEVLIFGIGLAIMLVGMIVSTYTAELIKKLRVFKEDLMLKKDKHYYERVYFYAKDKQFDKSKFFLNLIKNDTLKDISVGFTLGRMYGVKTTSEYNSFIQEYIDNL